MPVQNLSSEKEPFRKNVEAKGGEKNLGKILRSIHSTIFNMSYNQETGQEKGYSTKFTDFITYLFIAWPLFEGGEYFCFVFFFQTVRRQHS